MDRERLPSISASPTVASMVSRLVALACSMHSTILRFVGPFTLSDVKLRECGMGFGGRRNVLAFELDADFFAVANVWRLFVKNHFPNTRRKRVLDVTLSCRSPRKYFTPIFSHRRTSPTANFINCVHAESPQTLTGTLHADSSETVTSSSETRRVGGRISKCLLPWGKGEDVFPNEIGVGGRAIDTCLFAPMLMTTHRNVSLGGGPRPSAVIGATLLKLCREAAGSQPQAGRPLSEPLMLVGSTCPAAA